MGEGDNTVTIVAGAIETSKGDNDKSSSDDEAILTNNHPEAAPPTQLLFDDGSRAILEDDTQTTVIQQKSQTMIINNIREYYEIDKIAKDIQQIIQQQQLLCCNKQISQQDSCTTSTTSTTNTEIFRIALQFPDDLLMYGPDVCWELEQTLNNNNNNTENNIVKWFIFLLGDTTYAPCCPDVIAAQHLNAHILIHYGHACLSSSNNNNSSSSSSSTLPIILYSFGKQDIDIEQCVNDVLNQINNNNNNNSEHHSSRRFLLFYQVQYYHCIDELQTILSERGDLLVVTGQLPAQQQQQQQTITVNLTNNNYNNNNKSCGCNGRTETTDTSLNNTVATKEECCNISSSAKIVTKNTTTTTTTQQQLNNNDNDDPQIKGKEDIVNTDDINNDESTTTNIGGLEIPSGVLLHCDDYTVLYIGDDTSKQYMNIIMRFLSSNIRPCHFWTWNPQQQQQQEQQQRLQCDSLSPIFQRTLNRRFYLIQKVKQCKVFGILVGGHITEQTQHIIESIQEQIKHLNSYIFVVGKINPNKLANFPEIDCFILIACPEHSLLSNERELYHVPIITPIELLIAFNENIIQWENYSTHTNDYWKQINNILMNQNNNNNTSHAVTSSSSLDDGAKKKNDTDYEVYDNDDVDAPYFSLVSGTYEQSQQQQQQEQQSQNNDNTSGQLTNYVPSAAAQYMKQRTYQGLTIAKDDDEEIVHTAIPGQSGIASNYDNR